MFYRFRSQLEEHMEELAAIVQQENGKTLGEARAEVMKGIELTEFACSLPQFIHDEIQEVSKGIECRTTRVAVGGSFYYSFQFPCYGSSMDHSQCYSARKLYDSQAIRKTPIAAAKIAELFKMPACLMGFSM